MEEHLRQLHFRPVPGDWRESILRAAAAVRPPEPEPVLTLREALLGLLWPAPRAWAALGGAWILVLALQWTSMPRDGAPSPVAAAESPSVPSVFRLALGEQTRLRAELLGTNQILIPAVKPRRPVRPGPQSSSGAESFHC